MSYLDIAPECEVGVRVADGETYTIPYKTLSDGRLFFIVDAWKAMVETEKGVEHY